MMTPIPLQDSAPAGGRASSLLKLLMFSGIGVILFFFQVKLGGRETILVDHLSSYLVREHRLVAVGLILMLMAWRALQPLRDGSWRKAWGAMLFTAIKWFGVALALVHLTGITPAWANHKDMLPFLFERLALPVGVLIPVGALALTFLLGFGLLR